MLRWYAIDPTIPTEHPRGIDYEVKAIEAVEPTKVVGISLNLRNVENKGVINEL